MDRRDFLIKVALNTVQSKEVYIFQTIVLKKISRLRKIKYYFMFYPSGHNSLICFVFSPYPVNESIVLIQ